LKRLFKTASVIMIAALISACGNVNGNNGSAPGATGGNEEASQNENQEIEVVDLNIGSVSGQAEEEIVEENHDNQYRSELTNEWIDISLMDQRPIAVMVDNEITALDHYGINSADIVYEMMNSTANDRVTRLMVIVKDYQSITQFGSVRSVRPTNFMIAAEYNAIICHDGGPFYINDYIARDYSNNLNGGFARFSNGKATEFTEYITYETYNNPTTGKSYPGLAERLESSGYDTEYNGYYPGAHFTFSDTEFDLSSYTSAITADAVYMPFYHNDSNLQYNPETGCYEYYEYGMPHVDPLDDGNITSFKNVIIECCSFTQYDENGYMIYNVIRENSEGYYLTNGMAIPIYCSKAGETDLTVWTVKETGEEIVLNTGKTYVAIVPADTWNEVVVE